MRRGSRAKALALGPFNGPVVSIPLDTVKIERPREDLLAA